jgi:histidyl-tRNA synthetase
VTTSEEFDTQPVKGMRDFYPRDLNALRWLFGSWRKVAAQFGYEEIDAPPVEHEALYLRKAGEELLEQLYSFEDHGGRRLALRPEMTPSLVRMLLAQPAKLPLPARLFSIPHCFRYEAVQRGRRREHFQWNMDVVGITHPMAEAELMAAQVAFFGEVGLDTSSETPDIVLRVSDRRALREYLLNVGVPEGELSRVYVVADKYEKLGPAAVTDLLAKENLVPVAAIDPFLRLLSCASVDEARKLVPESQGLVALSEVFEWAETLGVGHLLRADLSIVRGLAYYTGTVWEVFDNRKTIPRAIAGGGRYDSLFVQYGGAPTPMVGFGLGDVVIGELLQERGLAAPEKK